MCPSHKTENLESCGFLRSVYRYMCDFLAENLSFLSHLLLTQSPSLGKNELSSEKLLADNPTSVQSLKRHLGEVSSEAFQMFLKERDKPLEHVAPLADIKSSESTSNGAPSPMNMNKHFLQVHMMIFGGMCICVMETELTELLVVSRDPTWGACPRCPGRPCEVLDDRIPTSLIYIYLHSMCPFLITSMTNSNIYHWAMKFPNISSKPCFRT